MSGLCLTARWPCRGNAGHCPPYLISAQGDRAVQALHRTGMALSVAEGVCWGQKRAQIGPGDVLVLYTDGVTEACNAQGAFLGKERLLESVRAALGCSAQGIQDALLADIREFVNDAPQSDDIALTVIVRD